MLSRTPARDTVYNQSSQSRFSSSSFNTAPPCAFIWMGLAGWFSGRGLGSGLGPSGGCTASLGWAGWWGEEEGEEGGEVLGGWEAATAAWLRRGGEKWEEKETEQRIHTFRGKYNFSTDVYSWIEEGTKHFKLFNQREVITGKSKEWKPELVIYRTRLHWL